MALELDDDFLGAPALPAVIPIPILATVIGAVEDSPLLIASKKAELPGVTEELLGTIYGGAIPEAYTVAEFVAQAIVYVETLIERDGSCVLRDWPSWLYHSLPFISSTLLKGYAELPSTTRIPFVPGDDANMGSGIHAYTLLGKKGLDEECFFLPETCGGKGKAALAQREIYAARYPNKNLLPPFYGTEKIPAMEVILGVDREFRAHPKTSLILANSEKELSLVWVDADSGCTCKARLDIWDATEHIIWDIKKCRAIDAFPWQIKELFYGVQSGHYFNGAVACGLGPVAFGFLPCEAFPPYQVGCGYRDPDKLMEDSNEAIRLIGLVKESQITGKWPNFRPPGHIYSWADLKPDDTVNVY